jgi:hypothetical protein
MFVEVKSFDDEKRTFVPKRIRRENVNAFDPTVVKMYGPGHTEHACVKVHMMGYWFWMDAADTVVLCGE